MRACFDTHRWNHEQTALHEMRARAAAAEELRKERTLEPSPDGNRRQRRAYKARRRR